MITKTEEIFIYFNATNSVTTELPFTVNWYCSELEVVSYGFDTTGTAFPAAFFVQLELPELRDHIMVNTTTANQRMVQLPLDSDASPAVDPTTRVVWHGPPIMVIGQQTDRRARVPQRITANLFLPGVAPAAFTPGNGFVRLRGVFHSL